MSFTDTVKEYAGKAVDKGSDFLEVQKLKVAISDKEKEIKAVKLNIADMAIDKIKAGEIENAEISSLVADIDGKNEEIKSYEEQIDSIKAVKVK